MTQVHNLSSPLTEVASPTSAPQDFALIHGNENPASRLPSRIRGLVEGILIAVCTLVVLFPDVIFLGASLLPSDLFNEVRLNPDPEPIQWLPDIGERRLSDGYSDIGASAWQYEPTMYTLARNIWKWESPFWNPYQAAGSLGPETLADCKFSLFSLIAALLGPGSSSFHIALFSIISLSLVSLYLFLTRYLELKRVVAAAALPLFLLTGYAGITINAQMGHHYFLFPALLLALCAVAEKQSVLRFLGAFWAHVAMFASTFLPILLLTLGLAHLLTLTLMYRSMRLKGVLHRGTLALGCSGFFAFLALAPLYFPIIESFRVVDTFTQYQNRGFSTGKWRSFFTWFTPRHFWESYAGPKPQDWDSSTLDGLLPHMGTFLIFFALQGLFLFRRHTLFVLAALLVTIVGFGRSYGVPPFTLIQYIPALKIISWNYWFSVVTLATFFLSVCGMHEVAHSRFSRLGYAVFEALHWGSFLGLYYLVGAPTEKLFSIYVGIHLAMSVLLAALVISLDWVRPLRRQTAIVLITLSILELVFYQNHYRAKRYEIMDHLPSRLHFLQSEAELARAAGNVQRILNVGMGGSLFPEWGSAFGIAEASTMNVSLLPWYSDFYNKNFTNDQFPAFLVLGPERLRVPMITEEGLDLASIRYIMIADYMVNYVEYFRQKRYPVAFSGDGVQIFENRNSLPRAYLVDAIVHSEATPDRLGRRLRKVATTIDTPFLEGVRTLGITDQPKQRSSSSGSARINEYHNASMSITTSSREPAVLVITDSWHPNWSAYVDGAPARVGRVNLAFRGIALPRGKHLVELRYAPASLDAGCLVSGLVLLLLGFFLVKECVRFFYAWRKSTLGKPLDLIES